MGHSSADWEEYEEKRKAKEEALAQLQAQDKSKREVLEALKQHPAALKVLLFDIILQKHPDWITQILRGE